MKLEESQVLEIAVGETDAWINTAREDAEMLEMHFYGDRDLLKNYLSHVENLETYSQVDLRQRFAISNMWLIEQVLRPTDNIWKAKGGTLTIEGGTETLQKKFKESIKNVKGGLSLEQYTQDVWFDKFITQPNGLTFLEVARDGEKAYFTQKSINNIKKMRIHGMVPEWVLFEPDVSIDDVEKKAQKESIDLKKEEATLFYWLVDDAFYYRIRVKGDKAEILTTEDPKDPQMGVTTKNTFGRVPAVINSNILDTKRKIRVSPIWKQIELLNAYVIDNSIKEIFKKKFGFPKFWMMIGPGELKKCPTCKGSTKDEDGTRGGCRTCGGTGELSIKTDVSTITTVKAPKSKEDAMPSEFAGYAVPPVKVWEQMNAEMDRMEDLVTFSHWGTRMEKSSNETATGKFIDTQPVENRLNTYADIVEYIHNKQAELWARYVLPTAGDKFKYQKKQGRRYMIETPDQLQEKYEKGRREELSVAELDYRLYQLIDSRFQNDDLLLDFYKKLVKVEPFVHMTIQEVLSLPVPEEEKIMKLYFGEWKNQVLITKMADKKVEEIQADLKDYIKEKSISNTEQE